MKVLALACLGVGLLSAVMLYLLVRGADERRR